MTFSGVCLMMTEDKHPKIDFSSGNKKAREVNVCCVTFCVRDRIILKMNLIEIDYSHIDLYILYICSHQSGHVFAVGQVGKTCVACFSFSVIAILFVSIFKSGL